MAQPIAMVIAAGCTFKPRPDVREGSRMRDPKYEMTATATSFRRKRIGLESVVGRTIKIIHRS